MQQDSLWAAAPLPVVLTTSCTHSYVDERYDVFFHLEYNQKVEGEKRHMVHVLLDGFELEVVATLFWAADRYFWKNRHPRQVEREIRKALAKYRASVDATRKPVNAFRAVDFG